MSKNRIKQIAGDTDLKIGRISVQLDEKMSRAVVAMAIAYGQPNAEAYVIDRLRGVVAAEGEGLYDEYEKS